MAEGGHQRDRDDEFREEYLTCRICHEVYTDPATLQCGHTYCRKCLTDFTKTKPDAVRDKVIPCALRCEGTKVSDPTKPVEEWALELKPHFIINGLMDKFSSKTDLAVDADTERQEQVLIKCEVHGEDKVLVCEPCKEIICRKCHTSHHQQCKSVVLMETRFESMQSSLVDHTLTLTTNIGNKMVSIATMKSNLNKTKKSKGSIKFRIEKHFQKIIHKIKKIESDLLCELDTVTNKNIHDLQERIQLEEMDLQMYQQRLLFIEQTMKSSSLIDTCNMYLSLVSEEGEDIDKVRGQLARDRVSDVTFSHDTDSLMESLNRLNFGKLITTNEQFDVENASVSDRVVRSSKIDPKVDTRVDSDEETPGLCDVTVLVIDDGETLVVTDWYNKCMKSFFTRNKRTDHSKLPLDSRPRCISQYKDNQVLVSVPKSKQIVRVSVRPQLVLLSVINTSKKYASLAVLSSSSLAAGSWRSSCVDILDMGGRVMRSIDTHNNTPLFVSPDYICVHPEGHLLVSDWSKNSVICVTLQGEVVWVYPRTEDSVQRGLRGITTTTTGDVLLVEENSNKIIQLSGTGQFVREVITVHDGIDKPWGLYLDKHNSLFVCEWSGHVKQFKFTS